MIDTQWERAAEREQRAEPRGFTGHAHICFDDGTSLPLEIGDAIRLHWAVATTRAGARPS